MTARKSKPRKRQVVRVELTQGETQMLLCAIAVADPWTRTRTALQRAGSKLQRALEATK